MAAEVVREEGRWTARLTFDRDAPVWAFSRSALLREGAAPWRPLSFRVVTPGVSLERIGDFDALVAGSGTVPREVTVEFTPLAEDLMADYDPAVIFSNGSLALYSGHFGLFPVEDSAMLGSLPEPLPYPARFAFADTGARVLVGTAPHVRADTDDDAYVIFGPVEFVEREAAVAILDPGLPEWLAHELGRFNAAVFAHYAERLGVHGGGKPSLLASWAGPTPGRVSMGGSVSTGMISMRFEGIGLVNPRPSVLSDARWFIAHEAAHFWLGRQLRYDGPDSSWITEGGADFLAIRATQAIDPAFDAAAKLAEERRDCTALLPKGPLETARRRNEHRAYYACGALFALTVEQAGAENRRDFADFVRGLIEGNAGPEIGRDEWLAAAQRFGVQADRVAIMRRLLAEGSQSPESDLAMLLGG